MQGILFKPWKQKVIQESPLDRLWQTRRLDHLKEINQEPSSWNFCGNAIRIIPPVKIGDSLFQHADGHCISVRPRYRVGETVYIKEVHRFSFAWEETKTRDIPPSTRVYYKDSEADIPLGRWRSPMFMPEWAARDHIKITEVRPERLKDITEKDAKAEGAEALYKTAPNTLGAGYIWTPHGYRDGFIRLWDSINKSYPFDGNYWVWRICFNLIEDKK